MGSPPSYEEASAGDAGFSGPSSSAPTDLPPAYHEQRYDPDEIMQPTIYVLADDHIFAESCSGSPRYRLSRVIHAQGKATSTIELSRVDKRIRELSDGTPNVTTRERHIYNMHYLTHFREALQCEVKSVAARGIGRVLVQKSPFPYSGYRAIKVPVELESTPEKLDKSTYLYAIKEKKDMFEWCGVDGKVVATEVCRDGERMLLVAVPLTRRHLDGLVALWCLWMWYNHVKDIKDPSMSGWADVKRIMHRSRETNTGITRLY
ncbi:hypothetical protein V8F06_007786 [Rhypophila decipiens]